MAEAVHQEKIPTLSEQWLLQETDELVDSGYPVFASEEIVPQRNDQAPLAEENVPARTENNETPNLKEEPTNVEEKQEVKENSHIVKENSATSEHKAEQSQDVEEKEVSIENAPATKENNENTLEEEQAHEVEGKEEPKEETPIIKLETAPADFRFPTTNQTRHCFTRYIEYHRCIAAKGEDAPECQKFAKYYRSLCPGEWIERWNEQRENGTFPGPL